MKSLGRKLLILNAPIFLVAAGIIYLSLTGGHHVSAPLVKVNGELGRNIPSSATSNSTFTSWVASSDGNPHSYTIGDLEIELAGKATSTAKIPVLTAKSARFGQVQSEGIQGFSDPQALFEVTSLDPYADGPGVIFMSFSGGAHCCTHIKVLEPVRGHWTTIDMGNWDGGPVPFESSGDIDGDGVPDIVFRDQRFNYVFGCYACTFAPPRIFNITRGSLADVSSAGRYAKLYEEDIEHVQAECTQHRNTACAAFVAEASRLGRRDWAWGVMLASYDRNDPWRLPTGCDVQVLNEKCPAGHVRTFQNFPDALKWFLDDTGYSRPSRAEEARSDEQSGKVPPRVYDDPVAYCLSVSSNDNPAADHRYVGPATIPAMLRTLGPRDIDAARVAWRCADGKLLACFEANTTACGKAPWLNRDAWPIPAEAVGECQRNPGEECVTGTHCVFRCSGTTPVFDENSYPVDDRGFSPNEWKQVESEPSAGENPGGVGQGAQAGLVPAAAGRVGPSDGPRPRPTSQPSFDCTKATKWSEKEVCSDGALAELDNRATALYRKRVEQADPTVREALLKSQLAWIRDQNACEHVTDGRTCLAQGYSAHIASLSAGDSGLRTEQTAADLSAERHLEQRATAAVREIVAEWSAPNSEALPYVGRLYGPRVEYYGAEVPSEKVLAEKTRFAQQWDARQYSIQGGTLIVNCLVTTSSCKAAGIMKWDARSSSRGLRSYGTAQFEYGLRLAGDSFQIVSESSRLITRQNERLAEGTAGPPR